MPANQFNLEYGYRLLYDCLRGACYGGSINTSGFAAWLAHLWLWIIYIGYLLAVVALIVIIYSTVRLFELRKREEEYYETVIPSGEEASGTDARWAHIQSLIESKNVSDWRTAIIEADIMLDDVLTRQGYTGESVGEKLKSADKGSFATLQDAWEAHKVRNDIAHRGSALELSEMLAQRTIARYESVFREFKAI